MNSRNIGSLTVSTVGLGCNNFGWLLDEPASRTVIDAAIDAGITLFDTADIYGGTQSESILGRALRGRRDRVVLATKFGMQVDEQRKGAKPDYIRRAVEDSLQRLQTDYIDLYQLHTPDPETPIADTLGALDELVKAGKVRAIGCSNFSAEQLREAAAAAGQGARFVSVQNEYSLLHRDPEQSVLPACTELGIAFLPYFPLASGLLTGKYRKGQPAPAGSRIDAEGYFKNMLSEANLERVEKLRAFAEARQHTLLELAFSWLLSHAGVASVIAGATKPEQIRANVGAADWPLSSADLEELDRILA